MRIVNDEEKTAKSVSNIVRIHIVIEEVESVSESSFNESKVVYSIMIVTKHMSLAQLLS